MTQFRNFHDGEARVQAESGIDTANFDAQVDQSFRPELNQSEVRFVGTRTFSMAASIDGDGRPWASPLIGRAGELFTVQNLTTVQVNPQMIPGDPLRENLQATGAMGILYLNPSLRRRAKSLGRATVEADGAITYRMHRMFGLCPKYIFKRAHDPERTVDFPPTAQPATSTKLSMDDRAQLAQSDTVFLASHSEAFGADATHRGGPSGFVTVVDENTLHFPEYIGNGMFQTLGNLVLDNRIALSSIDFATGRLLQVTGTGTVEVTKATGVQTARTVAIRIDEVRSSWADIGTWTDIEAFDFQIRQGAQRPI